MLKFIVFIFILYHVYKPKINLIPDPDIVLAPGGLMGFYVMGICHFIKNNYDIRNKKIIGFSAGSLNTIFLALDKKYDVHFLKELFKLNLHGKMYIPFLLNKTIDIINKFDINHFDTTNKYIASITNYNKLEGYTKFLNTDDMTKCGISSSFVPLITYNDIFYFYKGKCSIDGGFLYFIYKKTIKSKPLLLNYKMFKRYNKYNIPGYGLFSKNCSIYELYMLGYNDAIKNKEMLDEYLII